MKINALSYFTCSQMAEIEKNVKVGKKGDPVLIRETVRKKKATLRILC